MQGRFYLDPKTLVTFGDHSFLVQNRIVIQQKRTTLKGLGSIRPFRLPNSGLPTYAVLAPPARRLIGGSWDLVS